MCVPCHGEARHPYLLFGVAAWPVGACPAPPGLCWLNNNNRKRRRRRNNNNNLDRAEKRSDGTPTTTTIARPGGRTTTRVVFVRMTESPRVTAAIATTAQNDRKSAFLWRVCARLAGRRYAKFSRAHAWVMYRCLGASGRGGPPPLSLPPAKRIRARTRARSSDTGCPT